MGEFPKSRRVPCFNQRCWSHRIHHERPDEPRGQQMCDVPLEWDGSCAFCSITCACEAGFMTLRLNDEKICKKCFVLNDSYRIQHSPDWVCTRPEVTEEQYQETKVRNDERLAQFRQRIKEEGYGQRKTSVQ